MRKHKYTFNPETLSYNLVNLTLKKKLKKLIPHSIAAIVLSVIFYTVVFVYFIDSPKEELLKRENKQLLRQYKDINNRMVQLETVLKDIQQRDDNIYRSIFALDPIPMEKREAGFGGVNRYEKFEGYENSEVVIETTKRLDKLTKKLEVQSRSYDKISDLAKNKVKMLASVPGIMPVSNKDLKRTASGWGYRVHPIYKIKKFHYGMDFTATTGTDIYAAGDGKVVQATVSNSRRGYGTLIVIDHGFGYKTLYAHLSKILVKKGQMIKRGEVIGLVGNTGGSTAPHLHYEVHKNGKRINPVNYYYNDLTPEEYDKMIDISSNSGQSFD